MTYSLSNDSGAQGRAGGLRSVNLKPEYRSDADNLVQDFYVPCLHESQTYSRAVGFFTSSGLVVAAQGLTHFIERKGKMRLAASPLLTQDDINAIKRGYEARENVVEKAMLRQLEALPDFATRDHLGYLAWLIAEERLEIKIAVPSSAFNGSQSGIYHEKLGLFEDEFGNTIAFTGSPNETGGGLVNNFEAIDVFWSWDDPHQRVLTKRANFERLWHNKTVGLCVIDFPKAVRERLLSLKSQSISVVGQQHEGTPLHPCAAAKPMFPSNLILRDYQEEAIRNWFRNNGRGIFKMATGSGKTITALAALERLYSHNIGLRAVIIICPYRHLVVQWEQESRKFGLAPLLAFESSKDWVPELVRELNGLSEDSNRFLTVLTTNATFVGTSFQKVIHYFPDRTLLIADEAHNLGAQKLIRSLPENLGWRLALSATPERWCDRDGTDALLAYFGGVLKPEFTLKDALNRGALTPYRYFPLLVRLTDEEADSYADISEKISSIIRSMKEDEEPSQVLTLLLSRRARIVGTAENKLEALRKAVVEMGKASHILFYCGDGSVEDQLTGEIYRHVDAVTRLLGNELGLKVAKYTAETPLDTRSELRERFDKGEIEGLVAIRCLDEGVDIPSIRTAVILASSTNPRQFVQRRGRVLRRYPGKSCASIYDMVVLPPKGTVIPGGTALFRRELSRFAEFADLAQNNGVARKQILEIQKQYGLLDI